MIRSVLIGVFVGLVAFVAPSQVVIGDLGVTVFIFSGPQAITILHANGTSNVYPVAGVSGLVHAITYDPTPPGSFVIGGVGFLGRVSVSGGSASYLPISTSVGTVSQASLDGGQIIVFDSGLAQVLSVEANTGAITPVTSGTQPWGATLYAGCRDPGTGDLYVGGENAIWRIPAGTSTPIPFASGWAPGSSAVTGLAIDPFSLEVVATLLTVNRVVRVSPAGVLSDLCPPFSVPGPNAVGIDSAGDFVVAGSFGQTYRVPHGGGPPVLIGTAGAPTGAATGAATGVSAVVPAFEAAAGPLGAGGLTVSLAGVPPGTLEGFTVPSFDVALQVGGGPVFGLSPDAASFDLVSLFPAPSPGNVIHWSWPVAFPNYPAAQFAAPPGTLPSGVTLDILVVALNAGFQFTAAPVVRLTVN
jgi:hypothetical protein